MAKVKLKDSYPGFSLTIEGVALNKGDDFKELNDSMELEQAIANDFVEIFEESKKEDASKEEKGEIWVFSEQRGGKISDCSYELLSKANELAKKINLKVAAVLCCKTDSGFSEKLAGYGADKIYLIEHESLAMYETGIYTKALSELIREENPEIMLFGATHTGRDLAPRIAQRIDTGLTADCTALEIDDDGLLVQTKPAFGGNVMAEIKCPKHKPQMTTVRPGVFSRVKNEKKKEVIKVNAAISSSDHLTKAVDRVKSEKNKADLRKSKIIVACGRGLCSQDNLDMAKELASLLGAEIGASRAAVDSGWISKERQIGQTGKTVRPRLYLALGISGAVQHSAGMENSDIIVAINKDPKARIFEIADHGAVADINSFLPELIKKIKGE